MPESEDLISDGQSAMLLDQWLTGTENLRQTISQVDFRHSTTRKYCNNTLTSETHFKTVASVYSMVHHVRRICWTKNSISGGMRCVFGPETYYQ